MKILKLIEKFSQERDGKSGEVKLLESISSIIHQSNSNRNQDEKILWSKKTFAGKFYKKC